MAPLFDLLLLAILFFEPLSCHIFAYTTTSVEFMSVEDLIAKIDANIDMLDNDDYTYSFEYSFYADETSTGSGGDDILYVQIVMNMIENNENKGDME